VLFLRVGMDLIHRGIALKLLNRISKSGNGELWHVRRIMVENQWEHDEFFYRHETVHTLHTKVLRVGGTSA